MTSQFLRPLFWFFVDDGERYGWLELDISINIDFTVNVAQSFSEAALFWTYHACLFKCEKALDVSLSGLTYSWYPFAHSGFHDPWLAFSDIDAKELWMEERQ
jgi:hypothetical protein